MPRTIPVPTALLADQDLTPAAKTVWLHLHLRVRPSSKSGSANSLGITYLTYRSALTQLQDSGWCTVEKPPVPIQPPDEDPAPAKIPVGLLTQPELSPQAKLLYVRLQTVADRQSGSGQFTYQGLAALAAIAPATVRKAVRALAESGWIAIEQAHLQAPVHFTLRNPHAVSQQVQVERLKRRLEEAEFRGEAIMQEYLNLLVASDEFEENARPGFLVNPQTGERLEFDRYYPPIAAFEYNGSQHYRPTELVPNERAVSAQKARDLMKEALCSRRGVRLIIIHREDLSLNSLRQKIEGVLPLRDLDEEDELVHFLEKASGAYRAW